MTSLILHRRLKVGRVESIESIARQIILFEEVDGGMVCSRAVVTDIWFSALS
jgi:hypothetical protein